MALSNPTIGLLVAPRGAANRASTTGCHFYIREILAHAGLWFTELHSDSLADSLPHFRLLLMVGDLPLEESHSQALRAWVENGGALIGVGGTSRVESLWGVEREASLSGFGLSSPTLGEGYIEVIDAKHPVVSGLRSSLHFFNGVPVRTAEAVATARVLDAHRRPTGRAAICVRHLGQGVTVLIAPDLPGSVAFIQQGRYVDSDGIPAPDGTAPISDNILKADDSLVLDWHFDRDTVEGVPHPFFLHPVADELREILIRALFFCTRTVGATLPLLWYYPRNLPALAYISHDSDGNDLHLAQALLEVVREQNVRDTWCIQMPGYPCDFYRALRETGQEIALHFDALGQGMLSEWREENLCAQHEWLKHACGRMPVISNKNHYSRWQGRNEFFRWCAAQGISNDQSRGPSKTGDAGFPFGTAHPYFPMEDDGTRIDCLEIGFQSQDFIVFGPEAIIAPMVESAARAHGIAHVIFHPGHIRKPGVADSLRAFVRECRSRGMEFWTSAEIDAWERARRTARLEPTAAGWKIAPEVPLAGATVLVLGDSVEATVGKTPVSVETVRRYGWEFQAFTADIGPERPLQIGFVKRRITRSS